MATNLTPYEVEAIMDQYSRLVDYAPDGSLRNRLQYEEDRIVLFQSEAWTTNFTERERAEVVQRFLTMVAYHEIAESLHLWSPAHAGYTVRTFREMKSPYLNEKAEKIHNWSIGYFSERELAVYTDATK